MKISLACVYACTIFLPSWALGAASPIRAMDEAYETAVVGGKIELAP
jgi:hypothetical protein